MKLNNNDDSHNSGLNLLIVPAIRYRVTPYVGVWIETVDILGGLILANMSHTLRGCVD